MSEPLKRRRSYYLPHLSFEHRYNVAGWLVCRFWRAEVTGDSILTDAPEDVVRIAEQSTNSDR
jgi:hypothetical protein